MLAVQKMERDEWADLALFPFESDSASAIRRARALAVALARAEGGVFRVVARRESPAGSSPAFRENETLWAN